MTLPSVGFWVALRHHRVRMAAWRRRASNRLYIWPRNDKHRFRLYTRRTAERKYDRLGSENSPDESLNCKNKTSQFINVPLIICDPFSTSYCTVVLPLSLIARLISKSLSFVTLGTSSTWFTSELRAESTSDLRVATVVVGGTVSKIVSLWVLKRSW